MTTPKAGPINVLAVEDNLGDRRLLQELLKETAGSPFVQEWVDHLSACLERLERGGIDIVLLDLALPDSAGLETYRRVRAQFPDMPVILLTGLDDEELALQAVSEGAQEYLLKGSFDGPSLGRHIRHAIGRQQNLRTRVAGSEEAKRGKVIGFLGAKGGVGTTTLAFNVAAVLAQQNKRVVVAELMPGHGSLSLLLQQTPPVHLGGLLDLLPALIDRQMLNAHLLELPFGFRVLFAPRRHENSPEITPEQAGAILEGMASGADYALVDLHDCGNAYLRPAVRACDFLLMVLDPEPIAMLSAKSALESLESYGAKPGSIGIVVVNRAALRNGIMCRRSGPS